MSYDSAFDHFIGPMRRRFTIPTGIDQSGFLDDVADALSGYADEYLSAGADWFRNNRESRTFPTVAECKRVCATVMSARPGKSIQEGASRQRQDAENERIDIERSIAAWKLCRCDMGRRADRDGWLPALIEFAEDHGRMPEGREVGDIQAKARRSEDAVSSLDRSSSVFEAVVGMRKAMLDRAHERVFGYSEGTKRPEWRPSDAGENHIRTQSDIIAAQQKRHMDVVEAAAAEFRANPIGLSPSMLRKLETEGHIDPARAA